MQIPYLQGTINIPTPAYEVDILALRSTFGQLIINPSEYYVWFEDPEVRRLMAIGYGDDVGVIQPYIPGITTLGTRFVGNTLITQFDELEDLTGISDPNRI